jgi:hypothetical protein
MTAFLAAAIFFAGLFIGAAIAWFIRGIVADVQRDNAEVDHRVRAQDRHDEN